jgi:hypothetical protein
MSRKRVEPVLQDIEIEGAHLDRTEILDTVINDVKLKMLVGLPNPLDQFLKSVEGPSVYLMDLLIGPLVFFWNEVIQVS